MTRSDKQTGAYGGKVCNEVQRHLASGHLVILDEWICHLIESCAQSRQALLGNGTE